MSKKRSGKSGIVSSHQRNLEIIKAARLRSIPEVKTVSPVVETLHSEAIFLEDSMSPINPIPVARIERDIEAFSNLPETLQELSDQTRDMQNTEKTSDLYKRFMAETFTPDQMYDAISIGIRRQNPEFEQTFASNPARRK